YPFIRGVSTDRSGYRIAVGVSGGPPLTVAGLGGRTSGFLDLLDGPCRAAPGRAAAVLGALLPGLRPVALRAGACLLPDGRAGARTDLDGVDPAVWPALTAATTRPDRAACLSALAELGPLWLGFTQTVSVQRPAQGVEPWRDHAITPDLGDHGARGGPSG